MGTRKLRSRDSEATRGAALAAAQHLFAEKGFAGTSMREIAFLSGVSQPLIHYHFGSKDALYTAVKERLMKEGLRSVLPTLAGSPDSDINPSEMIRAAFNYISGNDDFMRLVAWSHLEGEITPWPGEEEFTRMAAQPVERHLSRISSGRDFDPLLTTLMVEALILFWSQYRHYYAGFFEEELETVTDRYLEHIARLFFGETGPPRKEQE